MSYGAITDIDAKAMDVVLGWLLPDVKQRTPPVANIVEIGTHAGGTARGFLHWANANNIQLEYHGIEAGAICQPTVPFPGANLIIGDSAEVFEQVPGFRDMIFVDGCHCINHVILDTIHYSELVRPGGYMVFHDTSPNIQHTMKDPHGPNTGLFHNSVNMGLALIKFPWIPWALVLDRHDQASQIGGMRVYRKGG